jgi:hypothetical protein
MSELTEDSAKKERKKGHTIEIILSIFLTPNQCSVSGIIAWNLMSLTPAIISVALKYRSAESPPRLRELYTRSGISLNFLSAAAVGGRIEREQCGCSAE